MKRIMFNDKCGLTKAVLEGRKTMARMIVKGLDENADVSEWGLNKKSPYIIDYNDPEENEFRPMYQVGDMVAIAQAYKELDKILSERNWKRTDDKFDKYYWARQFGRVCDTNGGWNNKMFVSADLMPHHIKITDIKVERLQDISEHECLREGIGTFKSPYYFDPCYYLPIVGDKVQYYNTPREAFAALINKVFGKGTWKKNPWVFVYSFELID